MNIKKIKYYFVFMLLFFSVYPQVTQIVNAEKTNQIETINDYSKSEKRLREKELKKFSQRRNSINVNENTLKFNIVEYENNNNFDDATPILDNEYFMYDNFYVSIKANLQRKSGIDDYDYFLLKLDRAAHIETEISMEYPIGYQFYLYNFDSVLSGDSTYLYRITNPLYWFETSENYFSYKTDLPAGTYFIIVISVFAWIDTNPFYNYKLNVLVEKEPYNLETVNFNDLKHNKQMQGAIWINDILPGNISPFLLLTNALKIYDGSFGGENLRDELIEDLIDVSNNIPSMSIYVFTKDLKEVFFSFFDQLSSIVDNLVENNKVIENKVQITEMTIEIISFMLDGITKTIKLPTPANLALEVFLSIGKTALEQIINSFLPKNNVQLSTCSLLCKTVTAALSFAVESNKIFKLSFEYDVYREGKDVYVQHKPSFPEGSNFSEAFIVQDVDSKYYRGNWYKNGDFFELYNWQEVGIANDEIKNNPLLNLTLLTPISEIDDVMPEFEDVLIDNSYPVDLRDGGYKWFKFTAPENKRYYIFAHGENANNLNIDLSQTLFTGFYNSDFTYQTYSNKFEIINDPVDIGVIFSYSLSKNDVIYLRVHEKDFSRIEESIIFSITDSYPAYIRHDNHSYTDYYNYLDSTYHKSYCICGEFIKEKHDGYIKMVEGSIDSKFGGYFYFICKNCGHRYVPAPELGDIIVIPGDFVIVHNNFNYYGQNDVSNYYANKSGTSL